MVTQQQLEKILDSVYDGTDVQYEINKDYNRDRSFTITILYPTLLVSNEEDHEIELENFVLRISGELRATQEGVFFNKFVSMGGYNLSPTEEMIITNYPHSHVSSLDSPKVCLGDTELDRLFKRFQYGIDSEDDLYDFFTLLDIMLHHESLEGGPYHYISEVEATSVDIDAYKYITTNSYHDFSDDYGRIDYDEIAEDYGIDEGISEFLNYIKVKHDDFKISDDERSLALYIHELIRNYLRKFSSGNNGVNYYFEYYVNNEDDANKYHSDEYLEVFSLAIFIADKYSYEGNSMASIVKEIATYYDEHGHVYMNNAGELPKIGKLCKILVNDDEYQDDLFNYDDVIENLESYAQTESEHDYDYRINVINKLSFFINDKLYQGEAETIEITNTHFNVYETIQEVYQIEGKDRIEAAIQANTRTKKSYSDGITRQSYDYLEQTSTQFGRVFV